MAKRKAPPRQSGRSSGASRKRAASPRVHPTVRRSKTTDTRKRVSSAKHASTRTGQPKAPPATSKGKSKSPVARETARKLTRPSAGGPGTRRSAKVAKATKPATKTTAAGKSHASLSKSKRPTTTPKRPRSAPPRKTQATRAPVAPTAAPPRSQRPDAAASAPLPEVEVSATQQAEAEVSSIETPTSFHLDPHRARGQVATINDVAEAPDPGSPLTLTAGDEDADLSWASTIGDETPGGDNPTPGMDEVDLIGRSLGIEYEDAEELQGADKLTERDRHRWELDPRSAGNRKARRRS